MAEHGGQQCPEGTGTNRSEVRKADFGLMRDKTRRDRLLPRRNKSRSENDSCFPERPPCLRPKPRRARTGQRELTEERPFKRWSVNCHEDALLPGRHE